jgi:hypothetical protein
MSYSVTYKNVKYYKALSYPVTHHYKIEWIKITDVHSLTVSVDHVMRWYLVDSGSLKGCYQGVGWGCSHQLFLTGQATAASKLIHHKYDQAASTHW